jgi:hypothetical protein
VDLVEVDVVGAEPAQAVVDLGQDRLARQAGPVWGPGASGAGTEYDEVYVGVRIVGPVQETVTAVILAAVPAVADPAGWFLDAMPGRSAAQGELVWSNLLDQAKLNDLLQEDPSER